MGKSLIIKGADFSQNGIVPDFVLLDWIAGTDTNGVGIVSNIPVKSTLAMELTATFHKESDATPQETSIYLPGYRKNGSMLSGWAISGRTDLDWGDGDKRVQVVMYDDLKHVIYISKTSLKIDNTSSSFAETPSFTAVLTSNVGIDCRTSGDNSTITKPADYPLKANVKIHRMKIWDGETLVLDVVPVKRTVDNVVCFYDLVQDMYFERNDSSTPIYGELS